MPIFCACTKQPVDPVLSMHECNMLEEELESLDPEKPIAFTPFRIRTIKVTYPLKES